MSILSLVLVNVRSSAPELATESAPLLACRACQGAAAPVHARNKFWLWGSHGAQIFAGCHVAVASAGTHKLLSMWC